MTTVTLDDDEELSLRYVGRGLKIWRMKMFYPTPVPTEADMDEINENEETVVVSKPNKFKVLVSGIALTTVVPGFVFLASTAILSHLTTWGPNTTTGAGMGLGVLTAAWIVSRMLRALAHAPWF